MINLISLHVWKDNQKGIIIVLIQSQLPKCSYGHMMTYFLSRTLDDGLPAGDFNRMNKKAKTLFACPNIKVPVVLVYGCVLIVT